MLFDIFAKIGRIVQNVKIVAFFVKEKIG